MPRQPLRRPDLFRPAEATLRVLAELDIVRRIGIHEVVAAQRKRLEVAVREFETREDLAVGGEVATVVDLLVLPERDVEFAVAVEAAQAVVAGAIEIVEQ